jgi:heme-degrading monooxygenase HmoA
MIQTILLFTLRPGVTDEQIGTLRAAIAVIPSEGRRNMRLGRDIGLVDGAMDLAIVTDYDDEDAYRRWLAHPEHARVRAELLAPLISRRERCQIRI